MVTGGQYDVDVEIQGPHNEIIYQQYKSQFDSTTFNTRTEGIYAMCFSNEFSTFSHKIVYLDLIVGDEKPLLKDGEHITVMTLVRLFGILSIVHSVSAKKTFRSLTHFCEIPRSLKFWISIERRFRYIELMTVFSMIIFHIRCTLERPHKK